MLAIPAGSVTTDAGSATPCPVAAVKDTLTSATGEPPASSTRTTTGSGSARPARPSWAPPDVTATATGCCATVTCAVALRASAAAVRVPDPFATAVTSPTEDTVKTSSSLADQVMGAAKASPYWSVTVAVKAAVSPSDESVAEGGEIAIAAARGGSWTGSLPDSPHEASVSRAKAAIVARRRERSFCIES